MVNIPTHEPPAILSRTTTILGNPGITHGRKLIGEVFFNYRGNNLAYKRKVSFRQSTQKARVTQLQNYITPTIINEPVYTKHPPSHYVQCVDSFEDFKNSEIIVDLSIRC